MSRRARVYYNEISKQKAAWLRHLIEERLIADGVVDERSIEKVQPEDLDGFVQCHWFAGIGLWSLCLRKAGWDDDRPVWSGSCPCGPFSIAGRQEGFEDPRHLWPQWFRLIEKCRPDVIFGEQSDQALAWLDLVQGDLEGRGYAVGSVDIPAAGFGGAHRRNRLGFVADAHNTQWWADRAPGNDGRWPKTGRVESDRHLGNGGASFGAGGVLGDPCMAGLPDAQLGIVRRSWRGEEGRTVEQPGDPLWAGPDWLLCRDRRWRPIEPDLSPLVDASPARMVRLRGYGDGIDVEAFTNLISAYMEVAPQ